MSKYNLDHFSPSQLASPLCVWLFKYILLNQKVWAGGVHDHDDVSANDIDGPFLLLVRAHAWRVGGGWGADRLWNPDGEESKEACE